MSSRGPVRGDVPATGAVRTFGPDDEAWPLVEAQQQAAANRALDEAESELRSGRLDVRREIRSGVPKQAILEAAGEHGSDLIVMGARGLGGFEALVLGSATLDMIRSYVTLSEADLVDPQDRAADHPSLADGECRSRHSFDARRRCRTGPGSDRRPPSFGPNGRWQRGPGIGTISDVGKYATDARTLRCVDCGREFDFTAEEQRFHRGMGFAEPLRCATCLVLQRARYRRETGPSSSPEGVSVAGAGRIPVHKIRPWRSGTGGSSLKLEPVVARSRRPTRTTSDGTAKSEQHNGRTDARRISVQRASMMPARATSESGE